MVLLAVFCTAMKFRYPLVSLAGAGAAADNPRRNQDHRRGGRAVECTGLENRQPFKGLVSSNLTLSANL